jgi:hypothetical protein
MSFDSFQTSGNSPGSILSTSRNALHHYLGGVSHESPWADLNHHIQDETIWRNERPLVRNAEAV